MKKRIFAAMLTAAMVLAAAGCGNSRTEPEPATESAAAATTQEASPEVAAELEWQDDPTAYLSGINAADYVDLPADYAFLTVEVEPVREVTDEDVEEEIYKAREYRRELQEVEGRTTVEDGDIVNIDYVGRIDGEEFAGGSDQGYDLTIGSKSFIPGFEDGLIGHEVGETVTLELTFPENYSDTTKAGVKSEFDVTINKIQEYVVPELTDEFVASLDKKDEFGYTYTSVDEYRIYVRNLLIENNEQKYTQDLNGGIKNALYEKSTFRKEIPGAMLERYKEYMTIGLTQNAMTMGVDLKTYMEIAYLQGHGTLENYDYMQEIEEMAAESAGKNIIVKAIGDKEGLTMTDDELQAVLGQVVDNSNSGFTSVDEMSRETVETIREGLDISAVMEFLRSKTRVVAPASDEGTTGETSAAAETEAAQ